MNTKPRTAGTAVILTTLVLVISVLNSSCGGTGSYPSYDDGYEYDEPYYEEPDIEVPETDRFVTLSFWHPAPEDAPEAIFIREGVDAFQEAYPNINVDLVFGVSSYEEQLATAAAAGSPPDIAFAWFNLLYNLQDALLPIDQAGAIDDDFLQDSLESGYLYGSYYGLPLNRDSCALAYEYLVLFNASAQPAEAFSLIEFLTSVERQSDGYAELGWYPTRNSVYERQGLSCPTNTAIRPPENTIPQIIEIAQLGAPALEGVLEGAIVMSTEATGVFEIESIVGVAAPVWNPVSLDEAKNLMETDGLVIGALFINNIPEYPPGDYVVKCWMDVCVLVSSDGSQIRYQLLSFQEFDDPVRVPRVSIQPGSKKTCHTFLIWEICTRIG